MVFADIRVHVPLLKLQALLHKPGFEGGIVFVEVRLIGVTPPSVFIALYGHTLDQLDFFRHDDSLAAISRQ
ncbi:hypothetical protein D3C86_2154490 [compost metagenome]